MKGDLVLQFGLNRFETFFQFYSLSSQGLPLLHQLLVDLSQHPLFVCEGPDCLHLPFEAELADLILVLVLLLCVEFLFGESLDAGGQFHNLPFQATLLLCHSGLFALEAGDLVLEARDLTMETRDLALERGDRGGLLR